MTDFEEFNSRLTYNPVDGVLTWKRLDSNDRCAKIFNTKYSGKLAGTINGWGYLQFSMVLRGERKWWRCHRVAWLLHTGEWPTHDIDHINGVRHDNRIENLRPVTSLENHKNAAISSRNTSGVIGVWKCGRSVSWVADITVNYVKITVGRFPTFEEAVTARKEAEVKYGFHKNHGRVVT